jgi:hypothetical protein
MVMNKKKIILISSVIVLALGGFAITQFLVKRVTRIRGGIVIKQEYPELPIVEPLSE